MTLRDRLEAVRPADSSRQAIDQARRERHRMKAEALAGLSPRNRRYTVAGYRVRITQGPQLGVERELEDGSRIRLLEFWLTVSMADGKDVTPADNHCEFENPPAIVSDPAGDIDRGDRGRFREDPEAVIGELVAHVIAWWRTPVEQNGPGWLP